MWIQLWELLVIYVEAGEEISTTGQSTCESSHGNSWWSMWRPGKRSPQLVKVHVNPVVGTPGDLCGGRGRDLHNWSKYMWIQSWELLVIYVEAREGDLHNWSKYMWIQLWELLVIYVEAREEISTTGQSTCESSHGNSWWSMWRPGKRSPQLVKVHVNPVVGTPGDLCGGQGRDLHNWSKYMWIQSWELLVIYVEAREEISTTGQSTCQSSCRCSWWSMWTPGKGIYTTGQSTCESSCGYSGWSMWRPGKRSPQLVKVHVNPVVGAPGDLCGGPGRGSTQLVKVHVNPVVGTPGDLCGG